MSLVSDYHTKGDSFGPRIFTCLAVRLFRDSRVKRTDHFYIKASSAVHGHVDIKELESM